MKPIVPLISDFLKWRFTGYHSFRRLTFVLAVALGYGVLFIPLYIFWGNWINLLSIIPVAMSGWYFGPTIGLFTCLLMMVFNAILWRIMRVDYTQVQFMYWIVINFTSNILAGYIAGKAGDLHFERKPQLILGDKRIEKSTGWNAHNSGDVEASISELVDFFPGASFAINRRGRICAWNSSIENLTGIQAEDILGKDTSEGALAIFEKKQPLLVDFVSAEDKDLAKVFPGVKRKDMDLILETFIPDFKPGGAYLSMKARPLYNLDGVQVGAVQIIEDVTDLRLAQERDGLLEQRDSITGLFTSNYFEKEIARLERNHNIPSSILLVRLLESSSINATRRLNPDELLKRTGTALKGVFRANDIVAYLDDSNFAVLVPRADAITAQRLAERLRKSLSLRNLGRFEPLLQFNVVAVTSLEGGTLLETFKQGLQLLVEE